MIFSLSKKTLLLISTLFLLAVVLLWIALLQPTNNVQPTTTILLTPTPITTTSEKIPSVKITSLTPDKTTTLTSGQKQKFTAVFDANTNMSTILPLVMKLDIQKDSSPSAVLITTNVDNSKKEIVVETQLAIDPYSEYTLEFRDSITNTILAKTSYLSDIPEEIILQNNKELASYLPYETAWYKLSYIPSRNVYVFNFKYDPSDTQILQEQFERAKQDAIFFIRSKGIDESTIVIEWRYS